MAHLGLDTLKITGVLADVHECLSIAIKVFYSQPSNSSAASPKPSRIIVQEVCFLSIFKWIMVPAKSVSSVQ